MLQAYKPGDHIASIVGKQRDECNTWLGFLFVFSLESQPTFIVGLPSSVTPLWCVSIARCKGVSSR